MKNINKQIPWLILIFGGIVSCWAAWALNERIEDDARDAFQAHAHSFQSSLAIRLQSYQDLLFGIAGLMSHSQTEVTPQEFKAYGDRLDVKSRYPALTSFNYAKFFVASDRESFVEVLKKDIGLTAKAVAPLSLPLNSNEHMVVTRVYPSDAPGASIIGFDLMTTSHRHSQDAFPPLSSSLYRPNIPVSSGLLLRSPRRSFPVLAVRLGVFDIDSAGNPRLKGTAGIGFNLEKFFKEVVPAALVRQINYRVENVGRSDGTTYNPPILLFASHPAEKRFRSAETDPTDIYTTSFTLPLGGALLRVEMSEAKSQFLKGHVKALPFALLVAGLLFFGMASVLSRKTLDRNLELRREVESQTAHLRREIKRTKKLERELARVADEERRRIGNELHDDLGQRLTAMSLSSKALAESLQTVAPNHKAQAEALAREAADAIVSVRGMAHGLMPVPPGGGGLREALEQLAISVSSPHTTRCVFDFDDPVDVENQDVAANLYRIAQEAVNNAIKYSLATLVKIRLDYEEGKVALTISDNGVGFQNDDDGSTRPLNVAGAGLRVMAHRASIINFTLTVDSSVGGGTTIKAKEC